MHQPFDPRIFRRELGTLRDAGYDAHLVAKHTHDETVDGIHISALPRRTDKLGRLALQRLAYQRARDLNAAIYHLHDPELLPLGWALKR
ncbi:MAG: glycosyl transferase, partial [Pseudomonadota bacterium]